MTSDPRNPFHREGLPFPDEPSAENTQVTDLFVTAITAHHEGNKAMAAAAVAALSERSQPASWRRAIEACLSEALRAAIGRAWQRGWQPADLLRQARRSHGDRHVHLLSDAIVAELQGYGAATIDPRWLTQLGEADAKVWWPADRTYLAARARHLADGWSRVLAEAVDVLCLLGTLPRLEQLGPLPGTASLPVCGQTAGARDDGRGSPADARTLGRIRSLLAKAESTTHEPEAAALIAAAQERMARHNIDLAMLASTQPNTGTGPSGRRIGIDAPYGASKAVLLHAVAGVNRCQSVWSPGVGFATVIGFDPDLDTVETLFASLLTQAVAAMSRAGSSPRTRSRAFRTSFLSAYASRVGERLGEAVRTQTDTALARPGGGDLLPVLASRNQAVDEVVQQLFPTLKHRSTGSVTDPDGWYCGRGAADLATLHTRQSVTGAGVPR